MFKEVTLEVALICLLPPEQRADTVARLTRALTEGALASPVAQVFALADCAGAHEPVEAGAGSGAILVRTGTDDKTGRAGNPSSASAIFLRNGS